MGGSVYKDRSVKRTENEYHVRPAINVKAGREEVNNSIRSTKHMRAVIPPLYKSKGHPVEHNIIHISSHTEPHTYQLEQTQNHGTDERTRDLDHDTPRAPNVITQLK